MLAPVLSLEKKSMLKIVDFKILNMKESTVTEYSYMIVCIYIVLHVHVLADR